MIIDYHSLLLLVSPTAVDILNYTAEQSNVNYTLLLTQDEIKLLYKQTNFSYVENINRKQASKAAAQAVRVPLYSTECGNQTSPIDIQRERDCQSASVAYCIASVVNST